MGKQYELLAVEPDLRQKATATIKKLAELFKSNSFQGSLIHWEPLEEGELEVPDETIELVTTVGEELKSLERIFGGYIDASLSKELTNSVAKATVTIDGEDVELSATALLNLEGKLEDLGKIYAAIPTLDPTEVWVYSKEQDAYVSDKKYQYRTKKMPRAHVLYEATEHHPAQVEQYMEDVPSHRRETVIISGAIPLSVKRDRLRKIDDLLIAVKKARQRANDVEAVEIHLAESIFDYINRE